MDFKTFAIKNILMPFFISVSCICVAMAVLGMLYQPDMRFGYQILISPLVFGAATTLTSLVNYSKNELTVREAFLRKLLQFVLIELVVLLTVYSSGTLTGVSELVSLALSVFLVFATVHLVQWIDDQKTAKSFNEALKKMQEEHRKSR